MKIGMFQTLRVQLVLLIIVALAVAQIISLFLFADERSLAIRSALGFEAAGRAANVVRLIEEAPADLQDSIIRAANSPLVRFEISGAPVVSIGNHQDGGLVESRVRTLLGDSYSRDIRVELHDINGAIVPLANLSPEMTEMHMAMMRGELSAVEMSLSIRISGGQWLNVGTRFERPPIQWPLYSVLTFGMSAAVMLAAVFWFVMTRLTGPLRRLVSATDRLGRGEDVAPLAMQGPMEVRDLTSGFNRMQDRLVRFIEDRTRVLAALGHDLRSPLTAMRVQAEMVDDNDTRDGLIRSVEEMQSMVEATLTFARGLTGNEAAATVEVSQFLQDMQKGAVAPFTLNKGKPTDIRFRPNAIRRALRNLIENAVRYGSEATVSWTADDDSLVLTITDSGPGIPKENIEQVFDPFFRLEESRSLETGGHGLGLSIARSIIRAHGGEISLENQDQGGLAVTVHLPLVAQKLREGA